MRVNLWHLDRHDASFNIVDIKPGNMEDLTEVITAAEFHPGSCNLFAYSSSKGSIRLADMRSNALCNAHCKLFDEADPPGARSFFSGAFVCVYYYFGRFDFHPTRVVDSVSVSTNQPLIARVRWSLSTDG